MRIYIINIVVSIILVTTYKDPTEFGTFMSALKCTKCSSYILPEHGFCNGHDKNEWKCNKCNFHTTQEKVSQLLASINNNIMKLSM